LSFTMHVFLGHVQTQMHDRQWTRSAHNHRHNVLHQMANRPGAVRVRGVQVNKHLIGPHDHYCPPTLHRPPHCHWVVAVLTRGYFVCLPIVSCVILAHQPTHCYVCLSVRNNVCVINSYHATHEVRPCYFLFKYSIVNNVLCLLALCHNVRNRRRSESVANGIQNGRGG
jgi:hypothetical protein